MALTTGMLKRFQEMASENNEPLLQVNLSEGEAVYGYLREVAEDLFVIQEVKGVDNTRESIEKSGETTLPLHLVFSWSKIRPCDVPRTIRTTLVWDYSRSRR